VRMFLYLGKNSATEPVSHPVPLGPALGQRLLRRIEPSLPGYPISKGK